MHVFQLQKDVCYLQIQIQTLCWHNFEKKKEIIAIHYLDFVAVHAYQSYLIDCDFEIN